MKNDISSYQNFVSKSRREYKIKLKQLLTSHYGNPEKDHDKIARLEKSLNDLVHNELINEAEKNKLFEYVNSEKIIPLFLKLMKGSPDKGSLKDIRDNNNQEFTSTEARTKYIFNYYSSIYKNNNDKQLQTIKIS